MKRKKSTAEQNDAKMIQNRVRNEREHVQKREMDSHILEAHSKKKVLYPFIYIIAYYFTVLVHTSAHQIFALVVGNSRNDSL